ncbi:MAG: SAM-dependent chlorinase/fluorinase [Armatimonadetes bacterium]|nr:SAM-dependent chlorinase/fluorinase [Armatimonadota bacterium]
MLLTDFGLEGPYVGQMKGVLAGLAPGHPVIDLTHAVAPQDVREGAFLLEVSWRYFPPGTVFIAVVDPGVGTDRASMALRVEGRFFVGPDNGLLTGAFPSENLSFLQAVRLENPDFRLPDVSATFHGRDLFAPAGAALATGTPLEALGPPHPAPLPLTHRDPILTQGRMEGRIVHIDRFGNLVSNIRRSLWDSFTGASPERPPHIRIATWEGVGLRRTYAEVPPGEMLALFGSLGFLEIGVNGGSAADRLKVQRGAAITVAHD